MINQSGVRGEAPKIPICKSGAAGFAIKVIHIKKGNNRSFKSATYINELYSYKLPEWQNFGHNYNYKFPSLQKQGDNLVIPGYTFIMNSAEKFTPIKFTAAQH